MAKVGFALLVVALCIVLGEAGKLPAFAANIQSNSDPESDTILKSRGAILAFLESGNYTYSESRHDIPKEVLDSILKLNQYPNLLGDSSVIDSVNLTCILSRYYPYTRLLQFAAFNDSICLLSYLQGGFSIFSSLEFIKYKGSGKNRVSFNLSLGTDNLVKLKMFLNRYPNIPKNVKRNKRTLIPKNIFIRSNDDYSKSFINKFKRRYSSYDSVALIQDSIIINRDVKNFIKIPTDLPLNKKVIYKSKLSNSSYTLSVTRVNFSTIKYAYQKVYRGIIQKFHRGEADLNPTFYLGSEAIFEDVKSNVYGMNEYINPKAKKQEITICIGVGSIEKSFIKFRNKTGKVVSSPELTIQP